MRRMAAVAALTLGLSACGGEVADQTPSPEVTATAAPADQPDPGPSTTASTSPSPTPDATASPSESATATESPTPTPTPTPTQEPEPQGERVITEDDSGSTITLTRDSQAVLRLHPDAGHWSEPSVEGSSVELAERLFLVDPGYREWEIRIIEAGSSRITSTSDPCPGASPPCGAPSRLFEVTIEVV